MWVVVRVELRVEIGWDGGVIQLWLELGFGRFWFRGLVLVYSPFLSSFSC